MENTSTIKRICRHNMMPVNDCDRTTTNVLLFMIYYSQLKTIMAEEKSIFQDLTCENTLDKWIKDKPFVWNKKRISFKTLIKTLGYEGNEYDEEQNIESSVAVHYTLTSDKSMFCAAIYKVVEGPISLSIFEQLTTRNDTCTGK